MKIKKYNQAELIELSKRHNSLVIERHKIVEDGDMMRDLLRCMKYYSLKDTDDDLLPLLRFDKSTTLSGRAETMELEWEFDITTATFSFDGFGFDGRDIDEQSVLGIDEDDYFSVAVELNGKRYYATCNVNSDGTLSSNCGSNEGLCKEYNKELESLVESDGVEYLVKRGFDQYRVDDRQTVGC